MSKTHFRKVFKSDHLGVADLEDYIESGSNLNYTITRVKQEFGVRVAGKKGDFNIAYFAESIKPLVLNATNSKVLKNLTGSSFVEDWGNLYINLYIDPNASIGGQKVGGVRINPQQPTKSVPELTPDNKTQWDSAKAAYLRDGDLGKVKARVRISAENEAKLIKEAKGA